MKTIRYKRLIVLIGTLLVFLFGVWSGELGDKKTKETEEVLNIASEESQENKENERETTKAIRVIDGDTIEIEGGEKVRYIGIDAPESVDPRRKVECFGKEAAEKNKELVEGKEVALEKDISERDKYGRLLRYVYVKNADGAELFVNAELVKEGYANTSTYPPDVTQSALFREKEKEARVKKIGLWGSCGKINE
ncbi:hypothetical protein A3A21_02790 [Candidatus Jorgensenbacteria bacterium RIFCSPLOWO2_01_FULL_45_25b]|uniref:TNase-like domain-containing protein n=1 Tax=Candidatus Jorgensenbacteria bacterium RIFCSPLOWO2_01_FULL_45_25b TaxID=1798471 RepID=A0A1F6C0C6_9BACT|nr:MAG: hypothetical protein A3A21_02790 [Candidatus Jorgensenbacteria bacterium RIFCSPLOWO2_01_FULL_45_25b]